MYFIFFYFKPAHFAEHGFLARKKQHPRVFALAAYLSAKFPAVGVFKRGQIPDNVIRFLHQFHHRTP